MAASSIPPPLASRFDPQVLAALGGLDLKARYVMEGVLAGMHRSPFHGFSVEFSAYREYEPGDDLRHLDWRLFARSDRLYIKQFLQETNARFYVLCDTSGSMAYRGPAAWGSKLEAARVVAAAMTWFLLRQNDAVGLVAPAGGDGPPEFIRPSQKPSQLGLMFRHLERLQAEGAASLAALLGHAARLIHRRSVVLLFSDLLEPSAAVALAFRELAFLGHECLVFQVLDRDELDFPFTEASLFEDLETGARRRVAPGEARARYLARFRAFMDEHARLFRDLGMPHCVLRTDEDPWPALLMFLNERGRRP